MSKYELNYLFFNDKRLMQNINYSNLSEILCKVGIVVIAIILTFMFLRWCHRKFVLSQRPTSLAHAKDQVIPTAKVKTLLPPPPALHLFGRSRSETIAINAFATILHEKGYDWQKIIVGYRPDFLKNPKTGRCLEIDAYYPDLRLGIEYNGIQHYKFPNHLHMDTPEGRKDFDETLERDRQKIQLAKENNVRIISIPYHVNTCVLNEVGEYKYRKNNDLEKWNLLKEYLSKQMNIIPEKE